MSGWKDLPAVAPIRAVTTARCSLAPSRTVEAASPVTNGLGWPAVVIPSHTDSVTSAGSLSASHTVTRFDSTRRRIGPASSSGRAIDGLLGGAEGRSADRAGWSWARRA